MIVNNTCPNVRIFSYKDAKGNTQQFFMFPGINGEVPEAVAENAMFKEQREAGLMVIIPSKKGLPTDVTRNNLSADKLATVPDSDVVETVLELDEKKALALIPDIVKKPTLLALRIREKRASVLAAIEKQLDDIEKLNVPLRK